MGHPKMKFKLLFTLLLIYVYHQFEPVAGQDFSSGRSSNNARPNFGSSYGSSFAGNRYEPVITDELLAARERLMYHYNMTWFTTITQSKPIHDQPLPFRLPFFGFAFSYVYVQKDGYLGFNKGLLSYTYPLRFPVKPSDPLAEEDPSIIAPWFAQQEIPPNNKIPGGGVYFQLVNLANEKNQTLKDQLILDFREGMIGAADFQPRFAIIITWRNMTFVNRRPETAWKTNTYQAVIATDEIRTYAMYNYEKIDWITALDNYDGMKGTPAYIGFNAGNTTRTFEFRPYSQFQRISTLTDGGFGNGKRGRYFFQIDEEVWPGACIDKELDPDLPDRLPLTFFPRWGAMLGGNMVNVTGPCIQPDMIITCNFDNWKVPAIYRSPNHASCISPPVQYHGYIDLSLTVNDKTIFLGRYYVQPPDVGHETIKVINDKDREEDPDELVIKWDPYKISWNMDASIKILLYGYRESASLYPRLTYIETLAENVKLDTREYRINVDEQRTKWNKNKLDLTFGFIAINLTDPSALGDGVKNSPTLWSRPMPLAWYFKKQWEYEYGKNGGWKDYFCSAWNDREEKGDRFATTLFQCPCTKEQALLDRGRFSPDLECNIIDRKCDTFHRGAQHCVRSARPSIGGSGQTCCYDDQIELLQTADTMYGGRPSRAFIYGKHPFKMRMMIPSLSHWVHDVMPFFFCCRWQTEEDNAETCQMYNFWRTSQDCSSYKQPGVASIYGDPHILTFDNNSYTFNGRGEFVLVHADNPMHKLDIQARFEQVPRKLRIDNVINATQLTAIAARDNQSATVEFRIRPAAARWRYQMYTIVDNEYVFFWDDSLRVQNFRGVSLYQPAGIQNMSHIIAMFDSGAGVEVMTTEGHMTARFYLPRTYMNNTRGLLGFYDGDKRNDFRPPLGNTYSTINYDQSNLRDLHEFGMKWRVKEGADVPGVGASLFFHNSFTFAHYDDPRFEPEMEFPPKLPEDRRHLETEMNNVCSDSNECRYDFLMTMDSNFAKISKQHQTWALEINQKVNSTVIRCPALAKPRHGRKSENRYWPGTLVRFSCDEGYRLTGYEIRQCREDGLWSWGEEAQCISETWWGGIVALIVLGILLPIFAVIGCCLWCIIKNRRSGEQHYTNEKQNKTKFSELKSGYSKVHDSETLPMKTQQQTVPMRLDSSTEVEV